MTWQDAPPRILSAQADSTGAASVTLAASEVDLLVEQIAVSTTTPGAASGVARVELDGFYLLGTNQGWGDSADGDPYVTVNRGSKLTIRWAGLPVQTPPVGVVAVFLYQQDVNA